MGAMEAMDMVTDMVTDMVAPLPMKSKSLTPKDRRSTTEPTMVMEVTDMEATDMVTDMVTVMVAPSPMMSRDRRATTAHMVVMATATVDTILVMVDTATDTTTTELNTNPFLP